MDIRTRVWDQLFLRVSRKPVTLVQVGANDGTLLSAPIRRFGWTGILIEPVPFIFDMLKSNYADVSGLVLLNVAIHAQDDGGNTPFYSVKQLDNPPTVWYNQLSSFKKEVLLSHSIQIPHLDELIEEIQISTRTFASIIMEFKIKNISVLFVDCEGYDGEIVRSFPFGLLHPTIIVYESKHLIQNDRGHTELILNQLGYNCIHLNDWDKNICAISHEFMSFDEVTFLNTLLS